VGAAFRDSAPTGDEKTARQQQSATNPCVDLFIRFGAMISGKPLMQ
jgi:hypothetical protein